MKLVRKLLMSMIIFAMSTANVYALSTIGIGGTFLHENIKNTMAGYSDSSIYIIASNNNVMVRGKSALGIGDVPKNTTTWEPVRADVNGIPIDDIVKIQYLYKPVRTLIMLNSQGEAFILSPNTKYPLKIETDIKFTDIVYTPTVNISSNSKYYLLSEDGEVYYYVEDSKILSEIPINEKIVKIVGSPIQYKSGSHIYHALALSNTGNVYHLKGEHGESTNVIVNKTPLNNVSNIFEGHINSLHDNLYYVGYNDGRFAAYNSDTQNILDIKFSDGETGVTIFDIVSDTTYGKSLMVTSNGIYSLNIDVATKTNITEVPVAIAAGVVLTTDGNYYELTGEKAKDMGLVPHSTLQDMKKWSNSNSIIQKHELANFNIKYNTIFERDTVHDIEFSMITADTPTAFNIYYTKARDMNDDSKKVLIESNVPYSSLNPKEYDSGYKDAKGNVIKGTTYTYNWKIEKQDLTNIQLIIEPIY